FYFRLLSGKLKGDGTWLNKAVDQPAAVAALGENGLKGKRVSNVAVTYKLMKLNQSQPAAQVFGALDQVVLPVPVMAGRPVQGGRRVGGRAPGGRLPLRPPLRRPRPVGGHLLGGGVLRPGDGDRLLQPKLTWGRGT